MTQRNFKLILPWAAAVVLIAGGAAALMRWQAPRYLRLGDGTEAFFIYDSKIKPAGHYPAQRDIAVDGDFFFRVPANDRPLIVRSRLLLLTVTGRSAFRMTAYAKEPGEQVEVLYGNVTARKNYPSPYGEADVLTAGQMTMINRNIDLMEKETADLEELRAWSETLVASVSKKSH